jgi:hypothetical protein
MTNIETYINNLEENTHTITIMYHEYQVARLIIFLIDLNIYEY